MATGLLIKATLVALLILCMACCMLQRAMSEEPEPSRYDPNTMLHRYEKWLQKHQRRYHSRDEWEMRFGIYQANVQYIDYINSQNLPYKLVDNEYADMTNKEFISTHLGYRKLAHLSKPSNITYRYKSLPANVDWRKKGAVNVVKDQGTCNSCWAFSVVATVEGINQIKTGKMISLSEQMLIDCDNKSGGCRGGYVDTAFEFIKANGGITTGKDYPLTGRSGTCNAVKIKNHAVKISGHKNVPPKDENSLQSAVAKQPTSVAVDAAGSNFQFYFNGTFTGPCGFNLNHAVTVVGYGEESGKYWLIKNSWSVRWGAKGYMRIERGIADKRGRCGIAMQASYPVK